MKALEWQTDSSKFDAHARNGDVALVAIRLQRTIGFIQELIKGGDQLSPAARDRIYKELDEMGDALGDFQQRLVGVEEDQG